jgi:hypothetical protein
MRRLICMIFGHTDCYFERRERLVLVCHSCGAAIRVGMDS